WWAARWRRRAVARNRAGRGAISRWSVPRRAQAWRSSFRNRADRADSLRRRLQDHVPEVVRGVATRVGLRGHRHAEVRAQWFPTVAQRVNEQALRRDRLLHRLHILLVHRDCVVAIEAAAEDLVSNERDAE